MSTYCIKDAWWISIKVLLALLFCLASLLVSLTILLSLWGPLGLSDDLFPTLGPHCDRGESGVARQTLPQLLMVGYHHCLGVTEEELMQNKIHCQ